MLFMHLILISYILLKKNLSFSVFYVFYYLVNRALPLYPFCSLPALLNYDKFISVFLTVIYLVTKNESTFI
jgi:hypothetical protein